METSSAETVSTYQPSLRVNVVANLLGRISKLALSLIFSPLYIHFLGIEAYGLIGFQITLQGTMAFLEMGLGRACNRELAMLSGLNEEGILPMRNTLKSLELVYAVVALFIGGVITIFSSTLAKYWLTTSIYTPDTLTQILISMAWVIAFSWPIGLYQGALMGLQQHHWMNMLQVSMALFVSGGTVLILWQVEPTIQAFFFWRLFSTLFSVVIFRAIAWRQMPGKGRDSKFSWHTLKKIYRFAGGVGINAILGTILRQADKLILSALLPLKQFAYYALATLISQLIAIIASTVSNAFFPRFSQMVGAKITEADIRSTYRLGNQVITVLTVPFALALAIFGKEALFVYAGDWEIAEHTYSLLAVLVVAKMLHSMMLMPYALQLAYGWLRLSIYTNITSVLWLIPAIYFLTNQYGAIGAAFAWLAIPLAYVLIGIPIMHKKILIGETAIWLKQTLIIPVIGVMFVLLLMKQLSWNDHRWVLAVELIGMGFILIFVTVLLSSEVRVRLFSEINRRLS